MAGRTTSVGAVTSSSAPTDGDLALFVPHGGRPVPTGRACRIRAAYRQTPVAPIVAEDGRIGRAVRSLFVEVTP